MKTPIPSYECYQCKKLFAASSAFIHLKSLEVSEKPHENRKTAVVDHNFSDKVFCGSECFEEFARNIL